MNNVILRMENINKSFSGVQALKNASLELVAGEVHALMGENGAGKSTLMKILTGIYEKDGGKITYLGKEVDYKGPAESEADGITIVHQELNMLKDLTVAQNLFIGKEERKGFFIDDEKLNEKSREVFKRLNIDIDPTEIIGEDQVSVEGHQSLANKKDGAKIIIDLAIPAEVKDSDAAGVATALLEQNDLIAIYGSNEFTANAIITANEGMDVLGEDKVIAIGFDSGQKQIDAIKNGLFVGSVTQNPVEIGYQAVKLAIEAAEGKEVTDVDTGALWYNSDNMEDEDIKPCLYQ